ncbi:MAG: DNA recombination protein RmuC, partial [Patescibacteria group bacterium]
MEIALLVLAVLIFVGLIISMYNQRRASQLGADPVVAEKLVRLEERIGQLNEKSSEITRVLDSKLAESTRALQAQFGQSAKIVQDVTEKLTKLDETNRQVLNFSDQLKNLQDILKNPKQRGVLGEYFLDALLRNVLPPGSYQMQYKFSDGEIVDAVVFMKDKVI